MAFLAIFLAAVYYLYEYVVSLFSSFVPQLKTIMIVVSIVAIFCAVIIASGLRASGTNNVSSELINLYMRLLVLGSERLTQPSGVERQVVTSELVVLEQQLALQGSQKVIAAYMKLHRLSRQEDMSGDDAVECLQKLLLEMRVDIGRKKMNFNKHELVELLLSRY